MCDPGRRIDELHYELLMLRTALEFITETPARERILARITACISEYTQLSDERLSAVLSGDERRVGQDDGRFASGGSSVREQGG